MQFDKKDGSVGINLDLCVHSTYAAMGGGGVRPLHTSMYKGGGGVWPLSMYTFLKARHKLTILEVIFQKITFTIIHFRQF